MTRSGCGGVCSDTSVYLKLSVLFLMSVTIYVYLYSRINLHAIEKIQQGILSDSQIWLNLTKGQTSRKNIESVIGVNNGSKLILLSHHNLRKSINVSNRNGVDYKSGLLLTLFTSWPTKAEKYICHNNTIHNWLELKPLIKPILFTNETLLTEEAIKKSWDVLPIRIAGAGVPVLKYMYKDAMERYDSPFYAYSNGDILYSHSLIDTLTAVMNYSNFTSGKPIMIIGRRTNVLDVTSEEASSVENVNKTANIRGKLYNVWGEDYFITSANYPWMDIPEVVIGRRAYDNWLVLNARRQKHITIDATNTLLALHQTTKAGNSEGFKAVNPNYNHNLLRKMYDKLHYHGGLTSCAEYFICYHNKRIQIIKRDVSKSCPL